MLKLLQRITVEPGKCGGKPCIRGKRMRVTDILDLLSHGASHEEILADYPFLERDDILAAIAYASRLTDHAQLVSAWIFWRTTTPHTLPSTGWTPGGRWRTYIPNERHS